MLVNVTVPCGQVEFPAHSVAFTGTAGNTTGWSQGPQAVLVWSTNNAYVEVGSGVTATTSPFRQTHLSYSRFRPKPLTVGA
jgi:hypothetical protein